MRKLLFGLSLICYFVATTNTTLKGQGCSDAGACSIGSLDTGHSDASEPRFRLSYDQSFGLGEKFIFISTSTVIAEHRFTPTTTFTVRLPFIITSGNLGNTTGIGDVLVSLVQQVFRGQQSRLAILLGGKLRTNRSDFSFQDNPLPMAYQTSLGTYDIITGVQYLFKKWDFYLAYQHPFGRNNNQYLHPAGEENEKYLYYESAYLKRGDDIAMRIQKTFPLENGNSIKPGVLPIYRIQKSEIIRDEVNETLDGSNGLTFNLFVSWEKVNKKGVIYSLTAAFPVVDKDYRADGLTRNFVLSFRITNVW